MSEDGSFSGVSIGRELYIFERRVTKNGPEMGETEY
jgi:hypothetical protein